MAMAENIYRFRRAKNLKQRELGALVKVTGQTISNWENGTTTPTVGNVEDLAKVFGCRKSDIVEGVPEFLLPDVRKLICFPYYSHIRKSTLFRSARADGDFDVPLSVYHAVSHGKFLEVADDSLDKIIQKGGYGLIDPDRKICDGDIAAVIINDDEAVFRRVSWAGRRFVLTPASHNDDHKIVVVVDGSSEESDQMHLLGKLVWVTYPLGFKY